MHYRIITHAQLPNYVASEAYLRSAVWPISPARAASYVHNPDARPEHPALFLAQDDSGTLRGFLGTLPDSWLLQGQQVFVAWLSCLWVDPACRGQGVAGALLRQAHEAWSGMLALTEFTPAAKALYDRSGLFFLLPAQTGWRAYRRPDVQGTVLRRWPRLAKAAPLLRGLDHLGERLLSQSNRVAPLPDSGRICLRATIFEPWQPGASGVETGLNQAFEDATQRGMLPRTKAPGLLPSNAPTFSLAPLPSNAIAISPANSPILWPTAARLQWIQEHPWLQEGELDDGARRYPFSSVSAQFQTWLWLVKQEDGEYAGVVSMSLRDGVLKLPYCLVPDSALSDVLTLARLLMNQHRAHTLVTHHQKLVSMVHQNRKSFMHLRPSTRYYMLSKELAVHWEVGQAAISHLQDGAGDAAFT